MFLSISLSIYLAGYLSAYVIVSIESQCRHGCDHLKQEVLQAISGHFYSHSNLTLRKVGSTFVIISCILINLCALVTYSDVVSRANALEALVAELGTKVCAADTWRLVALRGRLITTGSVNCTYIGLFSTLAVSRQCFIKPLIDLLTHIFTRQWEAAAM